MSDRADQSGMFWNDVEVVRAAGKKSKPASNAPLPEIPKTDWKVKSFPRLDSAEVIAIDTETFDPELIDHGPGWGRGVGEVVGISVATSARDHWYFPMRHRVGENLPPENVLRWAKEELTRPKQPKLFANAYYDIGWLKHEGVLVLGEIRDVQLAEPLIDENARSYSLETLCQKYGVPGKNSNELYDWCARAYGGKAGGSQRANIYRAPASLVGPYAEQDAGALFPLWQQQHAVMGQQQLLGVYDLEQRLVRLLVEMRWRGVRVDLDKAKRLDDELSRRIELLQNGELKGINVNAATDLVRYAGSKGIQYRKTEKGNPSFSGGWVDANMPAVSELRRIMKCRDTFVRGYVFGHQKSGRIHCQFNQLRSDDFGTVSGRFSSSKPNMQNIPARDEELAPLVRGLFVPDENYHAWRRWDWSQIEYRLLVHYARGRGAAEAVKLYKDDPTTDFHIMAAEITHLPRKPAKNMNFGMVYGMGLDTMSANMGLPKSEVAPMLETYHAKFPFVKITYDWASNLAQREGYITTILGRRARFDDHEQRAGRSVRARTHTALNRLLQGSAADIMKKAMVDIWESGACEQVGVPQLTVHDELDQSDPGTKSSKKEFKEIEHIMATCTPLRVPMLVSTETGPDWGNVK